MVSFDKQYETETDAAGAPSEEADLETVGNRGRGGQKKLERRKLKLKGRKALRMRGKERVALIRRNCEVD
ncbi:unnamed protein product [Dovyalis caffra]|uniref:Uncharacterized protein n=1 Tax=Dovyalis caffra TaxID=77055 RepID=A0AAV1QP17_9ROSI|nr:unnamed protein product [Dovyalis caffra]